MEIKKGENANLAGMEPPEGKVQNFDDPETIVDHIVGMVADDGSITDVARELAIDYVRTRLLYAGLERLAYIVEEKLTEPAGMEPRCPKCGSNELNIGEGIVECACWTCDWSGNASQFFRSPAPTPPLDVEAEKRIAEIRERESKATKGPWVRWDEHPSVYCENNGLNNPGEISGNKICECDPDDLPDDYGDDEDLYAMQAEGNADFIAHARLDIPFLLEQISLLRRHIASPAQPEKE